MWQADNIFIFIAWFEKGNNSDFKFSFKMKELSYASTHYGSQINVAALNTMQQCLRNLTFNPFLALINAAYLFIG